MVHFQEGVLTVVFKSANLNETPSYVTEPSRKKSKVRIAYKFKRSFFTGSSNFEQKRQKLSDQAMSCVRAYVTFQVAGNVYARVAASARCDGEGKW